MKTLSNKKLSVLAEALSIWVSVDEILTSHKIPCVAQCLNEIYRNDCMKLFEFGHKHWGKRVVSFNDSQYVYYAVGAAKQIQKILEQEIEDIEKEK